MFESSALFAACRATALMLSGPLVEFRRMEDSCQKNKGKLRPVSDEKKESDTQMMRPHHLIHSKSYHPSTEKTFPQT